MQPRRVDLGVIVLIKALACAVALAVGFRAVSDDDYARVTIAQAFATHPKLDPTGTSWLPLPFWLTGSVMLVVGRSLLVARIVAFLLGLASAVIVAFAAHRLTNRREAALAGAAVAAVFPWSVRLGVATVPELFTAALAVFALATLVKPEGKARLVGAAALACATLSRYDVWPIAMAFAGLSVYDMLRLDKPSARERFFLGAATILALAGPALWIAYNHVARGNPFDFLDRVAAYRRALGGPSDGATSRLLAYPIAMIRHEPELFGLFALVIFLNRSEPLRSSMRAAFRPYTRPVLVAFFQMALLSAAMIKDGAPTHHPERALLVLLILCALFVGNVASEYVLQSSRKARLSAFFAAACTIVLGLFVVRSLFPGEDFAARSDEVAVGKHLSNAAQPADKVLVEVADYGYFATLAALGRPEDAVLDRSLDPRGPKQSSSFDDPTTLRNKAQSERAKWVVGRLSGAAKRAFGEPQFAHGEFGVWNDPAWRP